MHLTARFVDRIGGQKRAWTVALLASTLGLNGADLGAVGAMAEPLQRAFHIGTTDIGLLLTVSLGAGATATLVFGALVDRINRTRLLAWTVLSWSAAIVLCGVATSYVFLLLSRVLMGGVAACATPAAASIIGDTFLPGERGRIYGFVLAGDLIGTGVGFILSGELADWTWRAGFLVLAAPAVWLAWKLYRLPEPERGGRGRLRPQTREAKAHRGPDIAKRIHEADVEPREALVVGAEVRQASIWWALRYVLRVPSNVVLIVASALGYFYLTGFRGFGIELLHTWYGVSHGSASALLVLVGAGGVAGMLYAGQFADQRIRQGHLRARVTVAMVAFFAATALFLPALLTRSAWVGLAIIIGAATALGAANPPLDAARLDIMPPGLWGRAESARAFLLQCAEAGSPITFGYLAEHVFGGGNRGAGLDMAFLVLLVALAAGGAVGLLALRTYLRDVATADASAERAHGDRPSNAA